MSARTEIKWLLFDLNSYFASVEQQENPKLRGKPIAVVPMKVDTTCAIAASIEAKQYGVKTGTLVKEARAMCPGIQFVEARHRIYVTYHHAICKAIESCIPIAQVLSIDEVACELLGSQREISKALALAQKIKDTVTKQVGVCLRSSIGLAPNQLLAKIASDLKKPDGLTVIKKSDLPQALWELKLQDVPGIGARTELRLQQKGISSVKQLTLLNQREMGDLWGGIWGERMFFWLKGEEVTLPPRRTHVLSHQHVLEPTLRDDEGAYGVLKRLLTKAAVRLRKNKFYTTCVSAQVKFLDRDFKLKGVEGSSFRRSTRNPSSIYWEDSIRLSETQDTLELLHALDTLWKQAPRGLKPMRVGVALSGIVEEQHHQPAFFDDPKRDRLNQALDRINEKYGRDTLHFGATHGYTHKGDTKIAFNHVPEDHEFDI